MLNALIAQLLAWFQNTGVTVVAKLTLSATTIVQQLPADEQQILADAQTKVLSDIQAGKSAGEALADGWTVFYNEERSEASKVGLQLFTAFCTALGANTAAPALKAA